MEFGNFGFLKIIGYSVLLLKHLNQFMYKTLPLVPEFYHLAYHSKTKGTKITKIIYWHPPEPPIVTLNIEMLRLQHFYNIFTTNHMWLVVIGSNLKLTLRLPFCPNNNN